jgi:hypothetical protein
VGEELYEVGARLGHYRGFVGMLAHERLWSTGRGEYASIKVPNKLPPACGVMASRCSKDARGAGDRDRPAPAFLGRDPRQVAAVRATKAPDRRR